MSHAMGKGHDPQAGDMRSEGDRRAYRVYLLRQRAQCAEGYL